ncbi:hypothetical protein EYW49_09785 [Siculibacillus lacustris]|uniref:Aspartate-semialdehyde dehydrogenase n=1 Tax=Siculibacillus lacustris TaxID=1549641 RepID=A0A4Q9VQV5_9HYPH|nr:usg protein [Siculibacillus lacustris]TBW38229.1 hypothetical protein EYW49_09785 [Siculibacillus lacustris]
MPNRVIDDAFRRQLDGFSLTTAHILYRMPDRPVFLQSFLWQHYDVAPEFPELRRFLEFWDREIEGPIHSVEVAHAKLIGPAEWRRVDGVLVLH